MLNWWAGHRSSDNGFDPDITAVTEGPETPAPVFAVRAFKHAIFGTPQAQSFSKPRRHSATDSPQPQVHDNKPSRPAMVRPKSWHEAQVFSTEANPIGPEPLPSPTKGILVTPGTAAARRKTVSFGDQVVDNEAKRAMKTGLPDDCPGKYPSPWAKPTGARPDTGEANISDSKGRNKLTEALEQAREDSAKRKRKSLDKPLKSQDEGSPTAHSNESHSETARYWKQEYDIYRENTTREVKKLVAKQQAAKNYARDKEMECAELREQLRLEQRKASLLEKRTAELEAQLKEFQEKLQRSHAEEHQVKQELGQLRRQSSILGGTRPTFAEQIDAGRVERIERRTLTRPRSAFLRDPADAQSGSQVEGGASHKSKDETRQLPFRDALDAATARTQPRKMTGDIHEDIELPPITGSTVSQSGQSTIGRKARPKSGIPLSKKPNDSALPQDTRSIALSMGLQPPSPTREVRQDSPMHSPDQARTRSHDPPIKASEETLEKPKFNSNGVSSARAPSDLSDPNAVSVQVMSARPTTPVGAKAAARTAATRSIDVKENVVPMAETESFLSMADDNIKPSAAWQGLTSGPAQTVGRRMVSKDGQEVGADRIAAARARILARGRQVS